MIVNSTGYLANCFKNDCPSRSVLRRIADLWPLLALTALANGQLRYTDLHRRLGGISHKMLAQTLRELEQDGLITRHVLKTRPPQVAYRLTRLGKTLCEPAAALVTWSERHINAVITARSRHIAAAQG